ncbi:MAG: DUF1049 domain-containing protein [Spirochaetales bacterium]|nr:DUF1049 domain-containing protein [Spirochaetales bacterium]
MPWKFIFTIIILVLVVIFAGFNVHPVSISFGFAQISEIPMFVCILSAFALGTIISVPFVMVSKKKKLKKVNDKKNPVNTQLSPATSEEEKQIVSKGKKSKPS